MKLEHFWNRSEIANKNDNDVDSLILIYTDTCDVRGPFVGENEHMEAYDRAMQTGRPFKFETWNRLG